MGNKRIMRSRRHETPSPDRELNEAQVETPMQGNETLTNVSTVVQEPLGENENRSNLIEPSQISNEIQVWKENFKQKNNDRIMKMKEMENKFDAILKEIRTNKTTSTITNPRSEIDGMQNSQPSGSKSIRSNGVHASNIENSDTEDEDGHPLEASEMHELRNSASPICQNKPNLNETIVSNEDSEEEDYHMVTGANRQLHRQSSQNPQSLNDTLGSHADQTASTVTNKPLDPINQIALAIEKPPTITFPPQKHTTFNRKNEKNEKFEYFEDLFHTTFRMQSNLTEEMKINHFHAHLRGLALKTFKNIKRTPTTTLEDILKVFRRKYVKPEPSASAKHRFNRLFFDPENQKLPDFLEELQESAQKAFEDNAHQMIENLLYAKMPPHLKKSINQAYLENGSYDQIVKHLEREMELNGLEADEPSVKTQMTATKKEQNAEKATKRQNEKSKAQTPKTVPNKTLKNDQCRYCKETGHMMTDCPKLAKRRKLEEDPDAEKCKNCNTPGHEEENCSFSANMENRRPKWNLTDAQKKAIEAYK